MPIIGDIIKGLIETADAVIKRPDAKTAQIEMLKKLLERAKETDFGKHYNFESFLDLEDPRKAFAEKIPYFDYHKLRDEWWQRTIDGEENVTWPGRVKYFAVSSGTTSKRKHIPVTEDMMSAIRSAGIQQLKGIADFDLPAEFFEKEILMFGSSTDLKKVNGHLEGEISGISTSQIPFWFEGFYRPGHEISSIDDWDERVLALAKEAPNWDIGAISGIPSWIELMIKKVIEYHNLKTIHDIWPNFMVYTSGGVAFEPYRKSFEKIMGKPIVLIDTYLASEGYIATQIRKESDSMALILDSGIYFEFVPFIPENVDENGNVKPGVEPVMIENVEEEKEYVLIISTVSGAWRYMIGDTIKFTDKTRSEIKITGRTKHFLNVVGSHLSVIQMNKAMKELSEKHGCDVKEFTVAAVEEDGEYSHRWYLGLDNKTDLDEIEIAKSLDEILQESNKNYQVARGKALKKVVVSLVSANLFQQWIEDTKQKGGQMKFPRVMKADDFAEWEEYAAQNA